MVSGARERRLDGPRFRGQSRASSRSAFERLGTDAAEMAVAAGSVVERLDIVEDIGARQGAGLVDAFWMRSFFRLLKKDSATALSQQLPRLLMLVSSEWAAQNRLKSSLPYWLPWSECTRTRPSGLRRRTAMRRASSASSRLSVSFMDQPTTLRAYRSSTTARYSQPCHVRM